jgi:hypothetical protein
MSLMRAVCAKAALAKAQSPTVAEIEIKTGNLRMSAPAVLPRSRVSYATLEILTQSTGWRPYMSVM